MTKAYITTSWDDGHPADARLAEMLERHGLTGTFYIPREIAGGRMSDASLADIARRFEVGAHTLHHTFLNKIDDATARQEIEGSRQWVEDATGRPCLMFCPPAGRCNARHWRIVESAGYLGARTVELMSLSAPWNRGRVMEMPTSAQAFGHRAGTYMKNIVKRRAPGNLWNYLIAGRSTDWPTLAERLLARVAQNGGVFHLWGHSWEIQQHDQWDQLERVLAMMGQAKRAGAVKCLTNGQVCRIFSRQGGGSSV